MTKEVETFVAYSRVREILDVLDELSLTPKEAAELLRLLHRTGDVNGQAMIDYVKIGKFVIDLLNSNTVDHEALEIMLNSLKELRSRGYSDPRLEVRQLESVKKYLAKLIAPFLKDLFVPKWVFDSIERELRSAYERIRHKESEIERLKRLIKQGIGGESEVKLYVATGLLEEYPAGSSDKRAMLVCPSCKEVNLIRLPPQGEVEATSKGGWIYRAHCQGCHRIIDLYPDEVLRLIGQSQGSIGRNV